MRRIIGFQVHHSANLDDASRFGVNMLTALEGALKRTGDPEIEQLLQRLERAIAREPLDRRYLLALDGSQAGLTGSHRLPVDDHRARPAHPHPAPVLGAGQLEIRAPHPEERSGRVGLQRHRPAVHDC